MTANDSANSNIEERISQAPPLVQESIDALARMMNLQDNLENGTTLIDDHPDPALIQAYRKDAYIAVTSLMNHGWLHISMLEVTPDMIDRFRQAWQHANQHPLGPGQRTLSRTHHGLAAAFLQDPPEDLDADEYPERTASPTSSSTPDAPRDEADMPLPLSDPITEPWDRDPHADLEQDPNQV